MKDWFTAGAKHNKCFQRLAMAAGSTGRSVTYGGRIIAMEFLVDPLPYGWVGFPKRSRMPSGSAAPNPKNPTGRAMLAELEETPWSDWDLIEAELGLERKEVELGEGAHGGIRVRRAAYGADLVEGVVLISAHRQEDGSPLGGAPKGCEPMRTSEVMRMREDRDAKEAVEKAQEVAP